MKFKTALQLLLKRGHGLKKNNLREVKKTSSALNLNNLPFKTIHIAGTNGKGTVSFMLAKTLQKNGFKTGVFTSPHIYDICERIQINGQKITKKDFAKYVNIVIKKETQELKFFEILTLASLLYFKDKNVDFAVIECGIGAKKDCTNIISPILSIITSVSLEHTKILGHTLRQIAYQKGGVIKKNIPCIIGTMSKEAKIEIKKISKKFNAPLFTIKKEKTKLLENENITKLATKILHLKKIITKIKMPCRFEVIKKYGKNIIKDGAHNPSALKELMKVYNSSKYISKNNTLIFAISKDKDYKTATKILAPNFKNIIVTKGPQKSVPPQKLKKYFKNAQIINNPKQINLQELNGNILICGSFYLCAQI